MLCSYWQDKTYDGYDIYPKAVPCQEPHERFSDSKELDKFFESSLKQIASDEALKKLRSELKFLCKHSVRTRYMVVFCRCQESSCPHCSHLPKPSEAFQFLWNRGGVPFIPNPSPIGTNHFMSFMEFSYCTVGVCTNCWISIVHHRSTRTWIHQCALSKDATCVHITGRMLST